MPLRGTIESVYKGTLVYAREHNPRRISVTHYEQSLFDENSGYYLQAGKKEFN